ncbi:hypothetical protein HYDPIDRAFT_105201, partial [Hydnomerulius pinastri MD-312]
LILIVAFVQAYWTKKWGPKWMLCLVIGEYGRAYAIGFALRFSLLYAPDSRNLYIVGGFFVVLSVRAFIADYVLLGRLARYLDCTKHLIVPSRCITVIFVAAGGGLSTADSISTALAGEHIFLAGLALQLTSFATFTMIYSFFLYRGKLWYNDWRALAGALCLSCVGILIRSVYGVVELSQGYQGYLATTEAYFSGLDALPLFVAISVHVLFWPGRFIPSTELPAEENQTTSEWWDKSRK